MLSTVKTDNLNISEELLLNMQQSAMMKESTHFNRVMLVILGLICATATVANLLLAYAVTATRQVKRNPVTPLLYSLCLCDLFIAIAVVPVTGAQFSDHRWHAGGVTCSGVHFANLAVMFASVFTLTTISWRRSFGVRRVLQARASGTRQPAVSVSCAKALIAIWTLSAMAALPCAMNYRLEPCPFSLTDEENCHMCQESWNVTLSMLLPSRVPTPEDETRARLLYSTFILLGVLVLPLFVIGIAYVRVCRLVARASRSLREINRQQQLQQRHLHRLQYHRPQHQQQHRQQQQQPQAPQIIGKTRLARSQRIFRLSIVLIVIFACFWSPIHLWNIVIDAWNFGGDSPDEASLRFLLIAKDVYLVFMSLALANSAANPLFLFATDAAYRRCLRNLLRRCRGCCDRQDQQRRRRVQYGGVQVIQPPPPPPPRPPPPPPPLVPPLMPPSRQCLNDQRSFVAGQRQQLYCRHGHLSCWFDCGYDNDGLKTLSPQVCPPT